MTFRQYLNNLFVKLYADCGSSVPMDCPISFHLVGGAARNYYLSDLKENPRIKLPNDIDIICTDEVMRDKLCELYAQKSINGSTRNSLKSKFIFDCKSYMVDLWYAKSPQEYVERVYTAADGICLSFSAHPLDTFRVCERTHSKEFLQLNFVRDEYTYNNVILHRKTSKHVFKYDNFKKHIQSQGLGANEEDVIDLYNRYKAVNT